MSTDPDQNRKQKQNDIGRWAGAGMQMLAVIGGFTALGWWLDQKSENHTPWWTLGLSLTGCGLSMYYLIRSFLK